jgi:hypothetical protein
LPFTSPSIERGDPIRKYQLLEDPAKKSSRHYEGRKDVQLAPINLKD